MLYYLLLIPAVLSTAWIYFLSPALSYWWLLPILIACFVAANLVYVLLMFVCTWFAGPNKMYTHISPFYHALTMALDGWILALCRVKIHVTGLEKVPTDTEYLFVSNHRSNFDPMVQWWVLRRWRLAFVSKPSNMRKFVIGPFVRRCCFLPIDRENARNALTTINAAADLIRAHECSFAIYPEGTRSKSGKLLPWHAGSLKIAQKANVPIVVATIEGTERIAHNVPWRRTHVYLSIREVIPAETVKATKSNALTEQNDRRAGQIIPGSQARSSSAHLRARIFLPTFEKRTPFRHAPVSRAATHGGQTHGKARKAPGAIAPGAL